MNTRQHDVPRDTLFSCIFNKLSNLGLCYVIVLALNLPTYTNLLFPLSGKPLQKDKSASSRHENIANAEKEGESGVSFFPLEFIPLHSLVLPRLVYSMTSFCVGLMNSLQPASRLLEFPQY